jgi:hypothetical protein
MHGTLNPESQPRHALLTPFDLAWRLVACRAVPWLQLDVRQRWTDLVRAGRYPDVRGGSEAAQGVRENAGTLACPSADPVLGVPEARGLGARSFSTGGYPRVVEAARR